MPYLCGMPFRLVHKQHYSYISNTTLNLKVKVIDLSEQPFQASVGKMDFYYMDGSLQYAFETEYDPAKLEDVTEALLWFADNQNFPNSNFSLLDPRSTH